MSGVHSFSRTCWCLPWPSNGLLTWVSVLPPPAPAYLVWVCSHGCLSSPHQHLLTLSGSAHMGVCPPPTSTCLPCLGLLTWVSVLPPPAPAYLVCSCFLQFPECLKSLVCSSWNPPPSKRKMKGVCACMRTVCVCACVRTVCMCVCVHVCKSCMLTL